MLQYNDKGIFPPSFEDVKTVHETVWTTVFGDEVNLNPQSVNGLMIQELSNLSVDNNNELLALYNNYSLVTATGIFLDFIGLNYNVVRRPGSYTRLQITLTGGSGTVIPQGLEISDGSNVYTLLETTTIGDTGVLVSTFQAKEKSSFIPVQGTVTNILTFVTGLESVTNEGTGDVAGAEPESDSVYRERISQQVFDTQRGTYRSLESQLSRISNDFIIIENFENIPKTISGVDIDPHSLWISSNQGSDAEIAQTIFDYKSIGCGLIGDVIVMIEGYEIKFNRPTLVPVNFIVQVKSSPQQPPSLEDLIKQTIVSAVQSASKIGQTLFSTTFVTALSTVGVVQIEFLTINGQTSVESSIQELLTTTLDRVDVQVVE